MYVEHPQAGTRRRRNNEERREARVLGRTATKKRENSKQRFLTEPMNRLGGSKMKKDVRASMPQTRARGSSKHVPKTAADAIEQVVLANRILANEGVLDALGHVSLRNPENATTFFQARSLSPFEVTKDDILEINLEGDVLTRTSSRPYGERIIHAAILKARPEMNAVFHGHPASVIPFSVTGVPIRPVTHVGSFLYQGVPVYDDYEPDCGMLISTRQEGQRLAKHLGQHKAHLLRGHGCDIVAESMPALVASAIYLRDNASIQLQALQLGKDVKYLTPEEAKRAMETALFNSLPLDRMWGYWLARVKRYMPDIK
jgi:3-hydroxy-2-methylpyridine-4,5-dicarboxylate 4-decarboxylase